MAPRTLQELIDTTDDIVRHMRASKIGKHVYPVVPGEYTNWMSEQHAWRTNVAMFDQTHHMDNLFLRGPDALRLIADTSIVSVANFAVDRAKQFVPTAHTGHVIGDGILFREAEEEFTFVGRAPAANWLMYNIEAGKYDAEASVDRRSPSRPTGPVSRELFRLQVQGPQAWEVLEKLNGGAIADWGFFRMGEITVDGLRVRALRHSVAAQPGLELYGPYQEHDRVADAIMEAGEEFGILAVGSRAYPSVSSEAGWIPSPVPAIYTGDAMLEYRRWLGADSFEAVSSLTGSFVSDRIEDYYLNPWELGYGRQVKFDHDFIGRQALETLDHDAQRRKVTLEWNAEDMARIFGSLFDPHAPTFKFFDLPNATYGTSNYDSVVDENGAHIGFSTYTAYSYNEQRALSLSIVDPDVDYGTEVNVVWGEPDGGRDLVVVPPHEQTTVRAVVRPAPYAASAREYHEGGAGWRPGR
ncbi:MAG TPA: aminomethyl transferase family protein [Blastococcus sp.]|nr:aminomethyl transferase family protein [Blastococcus sp.]